MIFVIKYQPFGLNNNDSSLGNGSVNQATEDDIEGQRCTCTFSLREYVKASLQLSVICGVIFGLFATLLWWIDLNIHGYCFGNWYTIPIRNQRLALFAESIDVLLVAFWPLLTIAPICSWKMVKESHVLFWCAIAALVDIIDRLSLYIFGHYGEHWKSYVGNVIFLVISLVVFYKFVSHRQAERSNNDNTMLIALKVCVQLFIGIAIFLPYNYAFLNFYRYSTQITRIFLSCSLIAAFYIPKLVISHVITNLHGVYKPNEGIVFAVAFLVLSTMVTRLTQARVENLTYFTIISLIHGIFNVVDKVSINLRTNFLNWICRRSQSNTDENKDYVAQYIVHQSLISIITETSSVIFSNAAAYILVYYYKREGNTGRRYDGSSLFKEMLIRSAIAIVIEWAFNMLALKVYCYLKIPVLNVWKKEWKFILALHLVQVIYVIVYFAHYVNAMLLGDVLHNSTSGCVGLFKRL